MYIQPCTIMVDSIMTEVLLFSVSILFLFTFLLQMIWYWGLFSRLAFHKSKDRLLFKQPVSVVVFTGDTFSNLKENIQQILDQDYEDFELLVVNNSGDEEIELYLESMSKQYPNLQVVNINDKLNFFKGRKFPISIGIKSAHNDIVLLTEPICKPVDRQWIDTMQGNFSRLTDVVLGYSTYPSFSGFFHKLVRFDNMFSGMKYLSLAMNGIPYTGNGRNIAYRRSLFLKKKGFINHYQISEGDSDFFVNRASSAKNTRVEISHVSHTIYNSYIKYRSWIRDKKRELLSLKNYKLKHKILVFSYSFSYILFLAALITLLSFNYYMYFVLGIFLIRLLSQLFITKKCMNQLNEKELLLISPLLELILLVSFFLIRFSPKRFY